MKRVLDAGISDGPKRWPDWLHSRLSPHFRRIATATVLSEASVDIHKMLTLFE